jgi:hypothetical protein
MLDKNEEQMIIKSATASNHELLKKLEQSNNMYLLDVQTNLELNEKELLEAKLSSTDHPYLKAGDCVNQRAMFTAFKPYLSKRYCLFNDGGCKN